MGGHGHRNGEETDLADGPHTRREESMAKPAAVKETDAPRLGATKALTPNEQASAAVEPERPDRPHAILRFLSGCVTSQTGDLRRAGRLSVEYDPDRLPNLRATYNGMATWGISANIRFLPGGQFVTGGLLQFLHGDPPQPLADPRPMAYELDVPTDATTVELWFKNSDRSGRVEWDSRFGENYWFEVGSRPPARPVSYRDGATTSLEMVNVFADAATKVDAFPLGEFGHNGTDLETRLFVQGWVRNLSPVKHVWVDLHVFDGGGQLIHSETLPLVWLAPAGGGGDFFVIDRAVYQGSVATPGSVSPRPDARTVQYRLYYEVDGRVYTDGVLHQHHVSADASVG
jgi:hypothetical protein